MPLPAYHPLMPPSAALLDQLAAVTGPAGVVRDAADQAPYLKEWRDRYTGMAALVLRPNTTAQVSEILRLCNAARVGVVPQGGNTGLVGGQIPFESGTEIVLSTTRLNRIRSVDRSGGSLIAEAGATLAAVQNTASDAGLLFPLSMASEGSCTIGGNLATNAGGIAVVAYGTARRQVLGLEVVLADGRVIDGLTALEKDNTGYDLKDLMIGSEGTLGVITAAALRLVPRPVETATAFVSCPSMDALSKVFTETKARAGTLLTAFEFMSARAVEFAAQHVKTARVPLPLGSPVYALIELSAPVAGMAQPMLESLLSEASDTERVSGAVIAATGTQSAELWRLREQMSEIQKFEGGSIKHDIALPISEIPRFLTDAEAIVARVCPGARPVPFGHFGDGNIHYNVSQPPGMDRQVYLALWDPMSRAVHDLVDARGGSISAEHGIGRMKRDELRRLKSPAELDLMRGIKAAFDPNGILNPGKLL